MTMKLVLVENCDLLESALLFSLKVNLDAYFSLMEMEKMPLSIIVFLNFFKKLKSLKNFPLFAFV